MAEAGTIVTDAEVKAMVPGIVSIDTRAKLIIQGAERAVQRYCGRPLGTVSLTDESIDIDPGSLYYAGIPVRQRLQFQLANYPIITFTSLKQVTSRDVITGLPKTTLTIPRDVYFVDLNTGIVHLLQAYSTYTPETILNAGMMTEWPAGISTLLATYTAGTDLVTEQVQDIKLVVFRVIARLWHQFENQTFNITGTTGEFGTTALVNSILTAEEKEMLSPFKRWVLC